MGRPPLSLTDCEVAIVGLGLMGGSLALEDVAGGGSRFILTLPLKSS